MTDPQITLLHKALQLRVRALHKLSVHVWLVETSQLATQFVENFLRQDPFFDDLVLIKHFQIRARDLPPDWPPGLQWIPTVLASLELHITPSYIATAEVFHAFNASRRHEHYPLSELLRPQKGRDHLLKIELFEEVSRGVTLVSVVRLLSIDLLTVCQHWHLLVEVGEGADIWGLQGELHLRDLPQDVF